jgi:NADH-quinone oxidoreductase subunit A
VRLPPSTSVAAQNPLAPGVRARPYKCLFRCLMNTAADFLPVLVQVVIALGLAGGIVGVSHLLGQRARKKNAITDTAYECGVKPDGAVHTRFSVKFYVTAMLFILFDIEVVFLIPCAFIYRDFLAHQIPILGPIAVFFGLLVLGLAYEVKKGALEWEK